MSMEYTVYRHYDWAAVIFALLQHQWLPFIGRIVCFTWNTTFGYGEVIWIFTELIGHAGKIFPMCVLYGIWVVTNWPANSTQFSKIASWIFRWRIFQPTRIVTTAIRTSVLWIFCNLQKHLPLNGSFSKQDEQECDRWRNIDK